LNHEVEAKIATQHGPVIDSNQEDLDIEISPLMNVLPELEYPVVESEIEGSEMYVDEVDPEKEDEREECVGVSAEVTMIDRDEGMAEGLAANDTFEEEMDVLRACVDEVSMYDEAGKSVMQQIRLDEGEVRVDVCKTPIPVQFQEKGGEEDKEEGEAEEGDCPSSAPFVYPSPKASISPVKSQVGPYRPSPGIPKSTHQPSISKSLDQTDINMSSLHNTSEEAAPITAQLITLLDSDSESEVDELVPSEPRDSQKDLEEEDTEGACTIAKGQSAAAESSFQQENNSIHSSETIGHGVGNVIVDEEELEYAEIRVDEPLSEIGADHTFSAQFHPVRQPEHLYSHNMQSTPVVSPVEVISITLPDDVSPLNVPSTGRFPTPSPVLDTNVGGTVEQSNLGSESQTLGDRIRSTKDASPSIADYKQKDILPVSRGVSESDISRSRREDENQEGRMTELIVVERKGSPMYIPSGSSSPTSNKIEITRKDNVLECIDLTDSSSNVKMQVELVDAMKREGGLSSSIRASSTIEYPEGTVRPRRKREKRRPRGWEKLKKRMAMAETEKEIIDFGAEASDEPDIRPVRGLELSNGAAEQASGDTNSANGPTTIATINLAAIQNRQERNEKRSKATTRIRRRQRINANQSGLISPCLIGKGDSDSGRPSKKTRTELRDIDVKPVVSGASSKQKKLTTKEKSLDTVKETATNQMQQPRTVDITYGVPSPSNRIKWPLKKTGEMHDKNVSSLLILLPGIDDGLFR